MEVKISKTLSYLLRHGARKENLMMREDGYIKLSVLLTHRKLKDVSTSQIEAIVSNDLKTRFNLVKENSEYWIRANQGHSIDVDVEMERITNPDDIPVVVHGTYKKQWESISYRY